ncbi:condensation domain-containing protein, partial [Streptomyces sp. NPDC016626]|uniref:condensation domain-containing protein n=1 Tax=Streptomyces sp. NPDC016626 TaxID=3364968 RepID=UPI0036F55F77
MSLVDESLHQSDVRPLSGAQEGLWYAGRLAPHSAAYNTGEAVEIHGALDTDVFETALRRAVGEADTFALRFTDTDDGPRCYSAASDWTLHRIDVSGADDPWGVVQERIRTELATPVETDEGPLFTHTLFTLAPDRYVWLLRAHHILLDGYSYKLLGRRLADIYNALTAGREPAPCVFAPVSRLQSEEAAYLSSERCARDRAHWTDRLAGLPEPARLTRRAAAPAARFLRRTAELEREEAEALSAAAARLDVTRTDLLTTAAVVYLHRMTGAGDLVLGMATMSRSGSAALRTPGTASDVLPLRVATTPAMPLAGLARAVADELKALRRHQQYRGEFIRRDLNLLGKGRRLYGPVLNIVPFTETIDFGGHPATWHHLSGGAVDDLQISVRPGSRPGGLWLSFDANPALYEEDELTLHRDRFLTLLRRLADAAPTTSVGGLDLLLPGEHPREVPVRDVPVTGTLPGPRAHVTAPPPEHTVPAARVPADTPAPDAAAAASGARPTTAEQALVCRLFEEILQLPSDTVGTDADFFELGGDSLLAARLLARLRQDSGVKVSLTVLFEEPTPAVLAQRLAGPSGTAPARPALGRVDRPECVPLSFAQERMWFLNRLDDAAATYNIPLVVPLGPGVDTEALRAALGDLADRHESLRTVFAEQDGVLRQHILPPGELRPRWHRVDCPAGEIDAHVSAACRHRFDLTAESPLAAFLFGVGQDRTLLLVLHHSAADGWSMRPFADDLSTAYAARRAGRAPEWEPLAVQYADYALWQRALLAPEPEGPGRLERLTAHWRTALAGLPEECTLPGDRPRPAAPRGGGAHVEADVDAALHRELLGLADRAGASLFMVLHAAVSALLTRCGAGEDIVLGTPVAGRTEPALDHLIGLFTNTVVLRADTSGNPPFGDLLARLRAGDLAALDHQDLPFDRLVDVLNPPRRPGRHPLFQVMLALQNNEPAVLRLGEHEVGLRPTATGTAKFDLFVDVFQRHGAEGAPAGLDLHVEFATDLYEAGTAEAFARALCDVLRVVCADPGVRVGELPA